MCFVALVSTLFSLDLFYVEIVVKQANDHARVHAASLHAVIRLFTCEYSNRAILCKSLTASERQSSHPRTICHETPKKRAPLSANGQHWWSTSGLHLENADKQRNSQSSYGTEPFPGSTADRFHLLGWGGVGVGDSAKGRWLSVQQPFS